MNRTRSQLLIALLLISLSTLTLLKIGESYPNFEIMRESDEQMENLVNSTSKSPEFVNKTNSLRVNSAVSVDDEQIFLLNLEGKQYLAVSVNRSDLIKTDPLSSSSIDGKIRSNLEILHFKNDPTNDFLEFFYQNTTRIMPKFLFSSQSPSTSDAKNDLLDLKDLSEINRFWKYSKKIECKNIDMKREPTTTTQNSKLTTNSSRAKRESLQEVMRKILNEKPSYIPATQRKGSKATSKPNPKDWERKIPLEAFGEMIYLRDLVLSHNIIPFLFFGALLGWYRECTIIPHTNDFDLAVREIELTDPFLEAIETLKAPLRPDRRFGLRNESLEYTVKSVKYGFPIDLFVLYDTHNSTYAAGQNPALNSYQFSFPKISDDEICAAELLNHFFYVPCQIERHIITEHGSEWYKDTPTRRFSWYGGVSNVKTAKKYPKEMKKMVEKWF